MEQYERLLERISQSSGVALDDLDRRVEAKRAKLSGLVSKEGAAQIIAAELGVSFDNTPLKIAELMDGMKRARVVGKVTQVFPVRNYAKNGREGKIGSFLLGDESSNIRVVLWDANHIGLIEGGSVKEGSVIEIHNAGMRNGELHLGAFSDLTMSTVAMESVQMSRVLQDAFLDQAQPGLYGRIRASIVQMFDPKTFDDKKNPGQKRALVNFVIDDGTETMRCVANDRVLGLLGLSESDLASPEGFAPHKASLTGEEFYFIGSFKINNFFNRIEFNIERIERIDADALVKVLERN